MKIFFLEDDDAIAMGLTYSLEKEGYEVTHVKTAAEALHAWKREEYSLCLLDINLPDGTGYDVCRRIKEDSDMPVIFLTAYDDEVNVVMGLEIGADDYVSKPFRIKELMARIKTVLRRSTKQAKAGVTDTYHVGNITVYPAEAKVVKSTDGKETDVELTAMEYRLFLNMINNRAKVLSRNRLLEEMWDVSGDFVNDNTLTVYIKRLRDKIEDDPAAPKIIKTVRGLGYMIPSDADSECKKEQER